MSDSSEVLGFHGKEAFMAASSMTEYTPEPKELDNECWKNVGFWATQSPSGTIQELAEAIAKMCNSAVNEQSLIAWKAAVMVLYGLIADPEEKFNLPAWVAEQKEKGKINA